MEFNLNKFMFAKRIDFISLKKENISYIIFSLKLRYLSTKFIRLSSLEQYDCYDLNIHLVFKWKYILSEFSGYTSLCHHSWKIMCEFIVEVDFGKMINIEE